VIWNPSCYQPRSETDQGRLNQGQIFQNWKCLSYPVYEHLHFHDEMTVSPLQFLMQDNLFRQAALYQVSVFKSRLRQQPLSPATLKYHQATLGLLNNRLSDATKSPLTNTTVWSITILANAALWLARHDEVALHVLALKRLCYIYGGKDFISQRPTLRYYIYR
jgi:hypothetical protein